MVVVGKESDFKRVENPFLACAAGLNIVNAESLLYRPSPGGHAKGTVN